MKIKPRLWTAQFFLLICITFLFFLSLHMLNAGFPVFISNISGSPVLGGIMTSAFMAAAISTRPFVTVYFIPKFPGKMVIGYTLFFLFICIILSYNRTSFPLLMLVRVLEGICFGIITTILATLATTIAPKERLGEGVGYFGMATSLGAILAPFASLFMIHTFSFRIVLIVTGIIILAVFVCSRFIQNINPLQKNPIINENVPISYYLFDRKALFPSILVFFLVIPFTAVFNFIDGLGAETGLGTNITFFFIVFMFMVLFIRPISGILFDRYGYRMLVITASFSGIIGLLLLSQSKTLWLLCLSAVFYGIAYATTHPTLQAWAVSQVSPEKKGTANAMILTGMDLGMAVGAPFLGLVASLIGFQAMFRSSSILIVIILILLTIYELQSKRNLEVESKKEHGFRSEV